MELRHHASNRLRKLCPQYYISPGVIDRHKGMAIDPIAHIGWLLCNLETQLPVYNPTLSRERLTLQSTLFIEEHGELSVCRLASDRPPLERRLDAAALRRHDQRTWSLYDDYGSRAAGEAITHFARQHGILKDLAPFAASDPINRP